MTIAEMMWEVTAVAAFCAILFFIILMRGVPMRMAIARLRHKTFIIEDCDTLYRSPAVKKENPEMVETKDKRVFGKAFRIKPLNGIKIGLAIPSDFILTEAQIAAGVEADNRGVEDPQNYKKMEESSTKVKYHGEFVKLSEITKGLTKFRSPVLIKAAMSRAEQEAIARKEHEPARWGMFVVMACIGIGFLAILLGKSGLI